MTASRLHAATTSVGLTTPEFALAGFSYMPVPANVGKGMGIRGEQTKGKTVESDNYYCVEIPFM